MGLPGFALLPSITTQSTLLSIVHSVHGPARFCTNSHYHTICTIKYSIVQACHVLHSQPVFLFSHCCSCHHLIILSSYHLVILSSSYHLCVVWWVLHHYKLHRFAQLHIQVLQKLILFLIAPAMFCTTDLPLLFSSFCSSLLLSFFCRHWCCHRLYFEFQAIHWARGKYMQYNVGPFVQKLMLPSDLLWGQFPYSLSNLKHVISSIILLRARKSEYPPSPLCFGQFR